MKKIMKKIVYLFALISVASPLMVLAKGDGITGIISDFNGWINALIPLIIGLAVIAFMWGLIQYISAGDDSKKAEAKSAMIYGIIILFVMVSIWGIVKILQDTFIGESQNELTDYPQINAN